MVTKENIMKENQKNNNQPFILAFVNCLHWLQRHLTVVCNVDYISYKKAEWPQVHDIAMPEGATCNVIRTMYIAIKYSHGRKRSVKIFMQIPYSIV